MKIEFQRAVLDYGYVKLVESWGGDESIIEAARMSTGKGFLGWGPIHDEKCSLWIKETESCAAACSGRLGDEKLLRYLWENKHATPFEMCGATFEIMAPIFVFREWHRHRTQSYNEMSARYVPLPDVNYIPSVERLMINSKINRQAGTIAGADELTEVGAKWFQRSLQTIYERNEELYQEALKMGVPKELARIHLPVGRYSRMRASTDLRNWLGFLSLRFHSAAQWEIRQFAEAVHGALSVLFPRTLELFDRGRL